MSLGCKKRLFVCQDFSLFPVPVPLILKIGVIRSVLCHSVSNLFYKQICL